MNTIFSLTGALYRVFPVAKYGNLTKRVIWLKEVNVKYPNIWQLELWHDNVGLADAFTQADIIECRVTVLGRISTNKIKNEEFVLNTLQCVDIKKA